MVSVPWMSTTPSQCSTSSPMRRARVRQWSGVMLELSREQWSSGVMDRAGSKPPKRVPISSLLRAGVRPFSPGREEKVPPVLISNIFFIIAAV